MNENNMNDRYYPVREDYESEIDLMNLLGHILVKWKSIVIVAIVCAVIGGVIGYVRSGKSDAKTSGGEDAVVATAAKLSEAQKAEADEYYEQLVAYDKAIDEQKKLYDESYYMNLDPYSAVGCHLWYMLETDLGNASSVYSDLLTDEDYRKIADALGTDIKRAYLKEIISFWADETMDTYKFDLTNTDRQTGDVRNLYKLLFKVTITAPDRSKCDKIAQLADEAVERETEALKNYGATIKCTKLTTRTYDTDVTERIIGTKQGKINALGNLETNKGNFYNNIISRINADEKEYIDARYSAVPDDGSEEAKTPAESKVSKKSILKYMIVVAFAGVFVAVCIIAAIYIFSGKLHVADEVSGMGIPVLRSLGTGRKISGNDIITRWGTRLMGADQASSDSFSILMEELAKRTEQGIKRVYIAIDKSSAAALEYGQRISNEANGNVQYYTGGILPDAGDMKELLGSDAVVIIPAIECTKSKIIAVFADICRRNGIGVIGSAPVR